MSLPPNNTPPAPPPPTSVVGFTPQEPRATAPVTTPVEAGSPREDKRKKKTSGKTPLTWKGIPLSGRLLILFTGLLTVALTVSSIITMTVLRSHLYSQVDNQLIQAVRVYGPRALSLLTNNAATDVPSEYYVRVSVAKETPRILISQTTLNLYGEPLISSFPDYDTLMSRRTQLYSVPETVPSTRQRVEWRAVSIPMNNQKGEPLGVVTIALPLARTSDTIESTISIFVFTGIVILIFGLLVGSLIITHFFKPLRDIEKVAGQIASGDYGLRVKPGPPTTEVGSLSNSLNMMLTQIQHSFEAQEASENKMRRFISDASHELRTPLAAIRGYGELYRMGGVEPERYGDVMGRVESEATRMGGLVEDLLQLARLDEQRPLTFECVDITELADGALRDFSVLAPNRHSTLISLNGRQQWDDVPSVWAVCAKAQMSQLITNLLSNIRKHTPDGTPVEIAVGYEYPQNMANTPEHYAAPQPEDLDDDTIAVIEIRDHGPGVSPQQADKVFERFYRADVSRSRASGGSGLGLSIVQGMVQAHNGTVKMLTTPGGGATVRVRIPCAGPHRAVPEEPSVL
ncbi:MAG: HAMP domain-containing sensor histidine kinase [Actinomycetaceae bacterium]|nr:HAMP domain-containing sensor histidine kinase [Actinomycetaceae bacterium]